MGNLSEVMTSQYSGKRMINAQAPKARYEKTIPSGEGVKIER
jgi:hypothetical protein